MVARIRAVLGVAADVARAVIGVLADGLLNGDMPDELNVRPADDLMDLADSLRARPGHPADCPCGRVAAMDADALGVEVEAIGACRRVRGVR